MSQIDMSRLSEMKTGDSRNFTRRKISRKDKEEMYEWMSEDAPGIYNYIIFPVGDKLYALDDDYMDVNVGVSNFFHEGIHTNRFGYVAFEKSGIRYQFDLPNRLGHEEETHKNSVVLHIARSKKIESDHLSVIVNAMPAPKVIKEEQISNPWGMKDYTFLPCIPRAIECDIGTVGIIDLYSAITKTWSEGIEPKYRKLAMEHWRK